MFVGAILCLATCSAFAQTTASLGDNQALREQQRQEEVRRALTPAVPDALGGQAGPAREISDTVEKPCFQVREIALVEPTDIRPGTYAWSLEGTEVFLDRCLGEKGLNALLGRVQNALVGRGLVTTRALAGPQNLKSGRFEITIVEGRFGPEKIRSRTSPGTTRWRRGPAISSTNESWNRP